MWYVAQVMTGEEIAVRDKLVDAGIHAAVPRETVPHHVRGVWTQRVHTIFPSYVFVELPGAMTFEEYYQIIGTDAVIRILGTHGPEALSGREAEYIELLAPSDNPLPISVAAQQPDGSLKIESGILQQLEDRIRSVDRHKRCVMVNIPVLQGNKIVKFGIKVETDP